LLPYIESTYQPTTDEGFDVPEAEAAIRRNIQHLHLRLLGEDLALDDPEIDITYTLWHEVWRAGKTGLSDGSYEDRMPSDCWVRYDPYTNARLPADRDILDDPNYTMRAWMAVLSYLLADWRFLNE
jgi:hypothetical protein